MNQNGSPTLQQWITRSVALYRGLLVFYPPAFRRTYGAQLAQTFQDQCWQAVCEHGLPGLFGCWMSMLPDLASNALAERLTEGYTMSRATFIRLAGGLTLVSVVLLIPILFSTHTPPFTSGGIVYTVYGPCNASSTRFCLQTFTSGGVAYPASGNTLIYYMVISDPTFSSTFPLVAKLLTACCFAVGLLGVTLAQRSWPGRLAGGMALLGQVGTILFIFVLGGSSFDALHALPTYNLTLLRLWSVLPPIFGLAPGLGLIICGLAAFKEGTLGGWKGALLLLGLWLGIGNAGLWWLQWMNPVLYIEGTGFFVWDAWGTSFFWISLGFTLYALMTYALWGWLGFKLWLQKTPPEVQIQAALG